MSQYQLRDEEVAALRTLLEAVVVQKGSGEVGVQHAGRFVSSRHGVNRTVLESLARKVGASLRST